MRYSIVRAILRVWFWFLFVWLKIYEKPTSFVVIYCSFILLSDFVWNLNINLNVILFLLKIWTVKKNRCNNIRLETSWHILETFFFANEFCFTVKYFVLYSKSIFLAKCLLFISYGTKWFELKYGFIFEKSFDLESFNFICQSYLFHSTLLKQMLRKRMSLVYVVCIAHNSIKWQKHVYKFVFMAP